ncbi:hypothetical protein OC845_000508 [Tilletia horrida]|nr:hypothetical protein OC845_000508 [Tilletia horrida]
MAAVNPNPPPPIKPKIVWRDGRRAKKGTIDYQALENQSLYDVIKTEADIVLKKDGAGDSPVVPNGDSNIIQRPSPSKRMTILSQDLDNQHKWLAASLNSMADRLRETLKESKSFLAEQTALADILKNDFGVSIAPLTFRAAGPQHLRQVLLAFASLPSHMVEHLRRSSPLLSFEQCSDAVSSFQPVFDNDLGRVIPFIRINPDRILGKEEDRLADPVAFRKNCSGKVSGTTRANFTPHAAAMDTFAELKVLDGLDTFTEIAPDTIFTKKPEAVDGKTPQDQAKEFYKNMTSDQKQARMAYGISVLRHELAHTRQATLSTAWSHQLNRIDYRIRWELLNGREALGLRRTRGATMDIEKTIYKDVQPVSVAAGTITLKPRSPGAKDIAVELLKSYVHTHTGKEPLLDSQGGVKAVDVFNAINLQIGKVIGPYAAAHEADPKASQDSTAAQNVETSISHSYSTVFLDSQWIRDRSALSNLIPWYSASGQPISEESQQVLTRETAISAKLSRGKDEENVVTAFQRLVDDARTKNSLSQDEAAKLKVALQTVVETGLRLISSTLLQRSAYVKMAENFVNTATVFFPNYQALTSEYASWRLDKGLEYAMRYFAMTPPEDMPAQLKAAYDKLPSDNAQPKKSRRAAAQVNPADLIPAAVSGGFLEGFVLEHDAEMSALAAMAPKRWYDRFDKVAQKDDYARFLNMALYQYSGAFTDTTVLKQLVDGEAGLCGLVDLP